VSSFFYKCPACLLDNVANVSESEIAGSSGARFMSCPKCRWRGYVASSALTFEEAPGRKGPLDLPQRAARAS